MKNEFSVHKRGKKILKMILQCFVKKGWFTPPFPTQEQLMNILNKLYKNIDFHVEGSMVYFSAVK